MRPISTKNYFIAFVITLCIFSGAFFISSYINNKRTEELKAVEDRIAIDILSFETKYDVIKDSSCGTFDKSELRAELDSLASKLAFMESQVGTDNQEVFRLKRYYSLLEVRDYLLTKRMSEECKLHKVFILYFYARDNCLECRKQEFILRALRDRFPSVEAYTFDFTVDLPAVKTLISLHQVPASPPVFDIQGKIYPGFETFQEAANIVGSLLLQATSTQSIKIPQ
jgi:hypothetical protein